MVFPDKITRNVLFAILSIITLILTIASAMAFSIDSDDKIYTSRGESVRGMFVIDGYKPTMEITSDSSWIIIGERTRIIDDVYAIEYQVTIPDKTDVYVYRETIKVSDDTKTEVMNVKISVQNLFFKTLFNIYHNYTYYFIGSILLILSIILYFSFAGARR